MNLNSLEGIRKQWYYYKMLGDKTFEQLTEEQLLWQFNSDSNSIAIIVKHLWGNMLSRWTDFLTSDGEKTWRDREAEFASDISSKQELQDKWEKVGLVCFMRLTLLPKKTYRKRSLLEIKGTRL